MEKTKIVEGKRQAAEACQKEVEELKESVTELDNGIVLGRLLRMTQIPHLRANLRIEAQILVLI